MSILDIQKIKEDFSIFKTNPKLVYLDSAASSQTPESVIQKMNEYYREYRSNIHRSMYEEGERATSAYEEARGKIAKFIGSDKNEVIFTSGSTAGMNMLMYSLEMYLELNEGDEIVTTVMEHHSGLIPLQELAKRKGLVLKHINITDNFSLDYEEAERLITDRTKIISVSLASNVLGTINDIKKLSQMAHSVGAIVICDGTKAVGHMQVDVRELDCDFLVFSGHKMCGPTGIGVLYGKRSILEEFPPSIFGGGMVEEVSLQTAKYAGAPARFEAGTSNIAGAIGLGEAVDYISGVGVQNIHEHIKILVEYANKQLKGIVGVQIFSQKDVEKNIGVVSFTIDGIHPHDVAEIAGREGVAIRAGHHCANPLMKILGIGALARASFYLYNDKSDIDVLVKVIKKAQSIFGNK